ncbi:MULTISPECIES: amino acid ABC transporter permease [unclassified Haladaptatus]|uniref:amino acid ABC transporter permease n=1 Tax=unclassified Haladaptatus TaxID=2622732 RepID=UPI0023E7B0DF|nr:MULTISPECIES: amino acid ABC transporter permease [unclassified Haladaptatus]
MSDAATRRNRRQLLGRTGRLLALAVGVLFWGWLIARWLNAWLFSGVTGIGPDEPFVSPGIFAGLAETFTSTAAMLGPFGGPVNLVGELFLYAAQTPQGLPQLAGAVWLTIVLTVLGLAFGLVIAIPLSVARVYGGPFARGIALGYIELIRGTPLLAQLFVLHFGTGLSGFIREFPGVGQSIIPDQFVWVAIIGFTINSAAYQAEYIRSALLSVEAGQLTAARAVGLSQLEAIRYVVLPQGLRFAIPGWSNEFVYLIKYSSLAAFITVPELFFTSQELATVGYQITVVYTLAALIYLALVLSASKLMGRVEAVVSIPGLGHVEGRTH